MNRFIPILYLLSPFLEVMAQEPVGGGYYVEPGSYGTQRETDPPNYVRNLGASRLGLAWLDAGLDYRLRYEFRENDIRRHANPGVDQPLLLRSRAYLGIRNGLEPLRFTLEFEDARRVSGGFPADTRDFNRNEFIQGFTEYLLADGLGHDPRGNARPVSLRGGRMAFEFLDRRLIGRNEWRNTTNTFDGVRLTLGQQSNDWQVDAMMLRPVTRLITHTDRSDQDQLFTSLIGHWRGWSDVVTLEPHYMGLRQTANAARDMSDREIHALGLRVHGWRGAMNYDVTLMEQFGRDGSRRHDARGVTAETGYRLEQHPWRPRLSAFYGYASGDRDPGDGRNNRFERFFGFARPWSADDYIIFENLHAPKLRVEFQPRANFRVDAGYGAYWLASRRDRFHNLLGGAGFNRDPSGNSGSFLGHGPDVRLRLAATSRSNLTFGYSHFVTGDFIRGRQQAALVESAGYSNFFYTEFVFDFLPH